MNKLIEQARNDWSPVDVAANPEEAWCLISDLADALEREQAEVERLRKVEEAVRIYREHEAICTDWDCEVRRTLEKALAEALAAHRETEA